MTTEQKQDYLKGIREGIKVRFPEGYDYMDKVDQILSNHPTLDRIAGESQREHCANMLGAIVSCWGGMPHGTFITALSKGDIYEAFKHADDTNFVFMGVYASFLYNEADFFMLKILKEEEV